MLDPKRLLTFRAVAEAGSFSAAARELSLTQPAVSQQVAALERELGARLLHRGPGGLTLTEAGTVALDHAQAVAERLKLADAQLAELGDDRGALRVGGFPSAMATLVPEAIASVVPQRVEAVEGTTEQLAAGVADGSLHVAVQPRPLRLRLEGTAVALGDGPRLRQVLYNLMKNAVEAAGPGGEVAVVLASSGHGVDIAVRDSGPGVPAAARARLFEPFFTTKPTGTGLGLAVSRAIALAHGGDIDVEASASGGAVFTLRLPRNASERRG